MKQRKKSNNKRCKSDIVIPVNKNKLLSVIDKLKRSKMIKKDHFAKVYNKNCFLDQDRLKWESPLLLVRYIRKCIVTQNWKCLAPLILHLVGKNINIYSSYVREMAFLTILMNNQIGADDLLQDFIRLCFVRISNNLKLSKHDLWFEEEDIKSKQ